MNFLCSFAVFVWMPLKSGDFLILSSYRLTS
uniref:Uncharacterized protein n=1 Tax=Rhizophora mucronata TaxID=61149 RepID=A0A2P2Q6L8_RHIMU